MFERGKPNTTLVTALSEALVALPLLFGSAPEASANPVSIELSNSPNPISPMARRLLELSRCTSSKTYPEYSAHFCRLSSFGDSLHARAGELREISDLFEASQFEDLDRGSCESLKSLAGLLSNSEVLDAIRYPQVRECFESYREDLLLVVAAAGSQLPDVHLALVSLAAKGQSIIGIHARQLLAAKQTGEIQDALIERLSEIAGRAGTRNEIPEGLVILDSLKSQLIFHELEQGLRDRFGNILLDISKNAQSTELRLRALEVLSLIVAKEGQDQVCRDVFECLLTLSTEKNSPAIAAAASRALEAWVDPLDASSLKLVRDALVAYVFSNVREPKEFAGVASAIDLLSMHYDWETVLLLAELADAQTCPEGVRSRCSRALEDITMVDKSSVGKSWRTWIEQEVVAGSAPWKESMDYQLRRLIQRTFDADSDPLERKSKLSRTIDLYRTVLLDPSRNYPQFESAVLDAIAKFGSKQEFLELAQLLHESGSVVGVSRARAISTLLSRVTGLPGPASFDDYGYWVGMLRFEECKRGLQVYEREQSESFAFFGVPIVGEKVVFLVDSSGSMKREVAQGGESRLEAVKNELLRIIDDLPDTTRVSVVSFSDTIEEVLPL
ncbi:MAG: VWA domain-containing protein, partial [Bdellovibrionales bacterium]|nr:VWA domain-containing protein [Bdellovibrionales bacterium]